MCADKPEDNQGYHPYGNRSAAVGTMTCLSAHNGLIECIARTTQMTVSMELNRIAGRFPVVHDPLRIYVSVDSTPIT